MVSAGDSVSHKEYGKGVVESAEADVIKIAFPKVGVKKFSIATTAKNGLIDYHNDTLTEKAGDLIDLFRTAAVIRDNLRRAENELDPYMDYLD